ACRAYYMGGSRGALQQLHAEQTRGITAKDKTTKYVGSRCDWTCGCGYGYITHDGYYPCGASLAAHENERCPGVHKDPRAADER
ncbi:hypothetical protein BGZ97_007605, partial [Linnemannia gamsii]